MDALYRLQSKVMVCSLHARIEWIHNGRPLQWDAANCGIETVHSQKLLIVSLIVPGMFIVHTVTINLSTSSWYHKTATTCNTSTHHITHSHFFRNTKPDTHWDAIVPRLLDSIQILYYTIHKFNNSTNIPTHIELSYYLFCSLQLDDREFCF